MNKIILMLLLAVLSSSAMAEWESHRSADDGMTLYTNPSTIRKNGDRVKMWALFDYKKSEIIDKNKRYLSSKSQFEFDCKEEQARTLSISNFSGNMGGGKAVDSHNNKTEWIPVPPESLIEFLWKYACGKK